MELAERFGAHVEFVHAVGTSTLAWRSEDSPAAVARGEDLVTRARERIVALLDEATKHESRVAVATAGRLHVLAGPPAALIVEHARRTRADMIVLGPLHKRGMFDFGSTARAVLAQAPCAVWTQPCAPAPVKRILAPFDFSSESRIALLTAIDFARRFQASVTVVHCLEPLLYGEDPWGTLALATTLQEVDQGRSAAFSHELAQVDWDGVEHEAQFVTGLAAERIVELLPQCDLVVMGTHGRTGLARAVLGSVAYSVLRRSTKPVLALRNPERSFRLS
jgi:nucleotide-binding universal stress UspA family protein